MFIKYIPSKITDKTYVSICHNFKDPNSGKTKCKVFANYGRYGVLKTKHNDVDAFLKSELSRLKSSAEGVPVYLKHYPNNPNYKPNELQNIGYLFLEKHYRKLEIDEFLWRLKYASKIKFDLNGVMKLMVFKRILSPDSKLSMYQTKNELYDLVECKKDDLYRCLTKINEHKDELLKHIHKMMIKNYNRSAKHLFYDVTNYYFEIDRNDVNEDGGKGLRVKGLSKENRDQPIVQMGLMLDDQGMPIVYDMFPGNQTDITTLKPFVEKYKNMLGTDDFTIVADKGLNSKGNLGYIDESGKKYIVAQKVRGCGKELLNQFLQTPWNEVYENGGYRLKSFKRIRMVTTNDGTTKQICEKVVAFWSKNFAEKQAHEREQLMDFLKRYINDPVHQGKPHGKNMTNKYLKTVHHDKKTGEILNAEHQLSIIEKRLSDDQKLDGIYFIITNDLSLKPDEIASAYHGLWKIEHAFRVIKSDFKARPIRHYLPERINAHFMSCFIALLVAKLLEKELGGKHSIGSISNALVDVKMSTINDSFSELYWPMEEKAKDIIRELSKINNVKLEMQTVTNDYVSLMKKILFKS